MPLLFVFEVSFIKVIEFLLIKIRKKSKNLFFRILFIPNDILFGKNYNPNLFFHRKPKVTNYVVEFSSFVSFV